MNINKRLLEVRKVLDLSQQEVADKLEVSRSYIAKLELGNGDFRASFINHFCTTYNINEEWFKTGNGNMFKIDDGEHELSYLFGIFLANEDEFKHNFIKTLLSMNEDQWDTIHQLIINMSKSCVK